MKRLIALAAVLAALAPAVAAQTPASFTGNCQGTSAGRHGRRARRRRARPRQGRRRESKVMLERWIRDFTHAARSLGRAPGFPLVVVGTLALAIGANAAIFSVVNAVLLEPLPFPHADRLVHIAGTAPRGGLPGGGGGG